MANFTCPFCGYTAKDTAFLEGMCPACVRDLGTGEKVADAIPKVFHDPSNTVNTKDEVEEQ
jgi:NMD protein affecting ribosome stability and mRNA decay